MRKVVLAIDGKYLSNPTFVEDIVLLANNSAEYLVPITELDAASNS